MFETAGFIFIIFGISFIVMLFKTDKELLPMIIFIILICVLMAHKLLSV